MGLLRARGLPETVSVATGRGWHLYFAGSLRSLVGVLPGVDTRGEGGYVVAPPSVHETGKIYAWDDSPEHVALAPVPPWLVSLGTRAAHVSAADPLADAVIEGGRNSALTSLAGTIRRRGIGEGLLFEMLRSANDRLCRPPLDEKELQKIAHSVAAYTPAEPLPTSGSSVSGGLELWTAADMAGDPPPTDYLAPGIHLAPGRPFGLTGYAGSGKTIALCDLLLSVASHGRDGELSAAWGCVDIARGGPVVHLDFEVGKKGTWRRYKQLAWGRGFDVTELGDLLSWRSYPAFRLNQPDARDVLRRLLEGKALAGLDSLKAMLPGTKENDSEIADHVGVLGEVSEETGCAIAVLHHEGKPGEAAKGAQFRGRGSSAIQGCFSSQWSLTPGEKFRSFNHGKSEHDELCPEIRVRFVGHGPRLSDGKSRELRLEALGPEDFTQTDSNAVYTELKNRMFAHVASLSSPAWSASTPNGCPGLLALWEAMKLRGETTKNKSELQPQWDELTKGQNAPLVNVGRGGKWARWIARSL